MSKVRYAVDECYAINRSHDTSSRSHDTSRTTSSSRKTPEPGGTIRENTQ